MILNDPIQCSSATTCFHFDNEGIATLLYEGVYCIIDFDIHSLLFREYYRFKRKLTEGLD